MVLDVLTGIHLRPPETISQQERMVKQTAHLIIQEDLGVGVPQAPLKVAPNNLKTYQVPSPKVTKFQ